MKRYIKEINIRNMPFRIKKMRIKD